MGDRTRHRRRVVVAWTGHAGAALLVLWFVSGGTAAQPLDCPGLSSFATRIEAAARDELTPALREAEQAINDQWPALERAGCYKWLADLYRDIGSYRAEVLYGRAEELAPENPELLEAVARYYRNHRGAKGLFARSEQYYLRADRAFRSAFPEEAASETLPPWAADLRERIGRGRIELAKREGLGLLVPSHAEDRFGLYLGLEVDHGAFPVAQTDLATPALTLLQVVPALETSSLLRDLDRTRTRGRLRFRFGSLPYWDVAWTRLTQQETFTSQTPPVSFADLEVDELEIGLEDTVGAAPVADFLWRLEFRTGTFDAVDLGREDSRRVTASSSITRLFGRLKASVDLLGSFAENTLEDGSVDRDRLAAPTLRLVHFRSPRETARRIIDPRSYEYALGYVRRNREFGEHVKLIQETTFVSLTFTEVLPKTDVVLLPNYFRNTVEGQPGRDSSDLELNLMLTHRVIDRVNNLLIRQSDRAVGIAQWALGLRLVADGTRASFDDFESRAVIASSLLELFSGPGNNSTFILDAAFESREYVNLRKRQEQARVSLRIGF